MAKTWVLDTDTKGTGARVVPLEDVQAEPSKPEPVAKPRALRPSTHRPQPRKPEAPREVRKTATPLPPGHVRKKATGEIGRVKAVDPRAGTADVLWLKQGRVSTVPLSAITRH